MKLRHAVYDDWKILLDWRNDPTTRINSFNQEVIEEAVHKEWFYKSLQTPERTIFILETDSEIPVGTIRSDEIEPNVFVLSWSISPRERKKGYGKLLLELFLKQKNGKFIAEIKPENIGSIKMVESNHFTKVDAKTYIRIL